MEYGFPFPELAGAVPHINDDARSKSHQNTEQIATTNFYLNIPEDDELSRDFLPRMVIPKLSRQFRDPPSLQVCEL